MTCRKCGVAISSRRHRDGQRRHQARGLCNPCYKAEQRAGTLERWPPIGNVQVNHEQRAATVEDVEWMRDTGAHPEWWAPRLGISHDALVHRLRRAGRPDLASEVSLVRYHTGRK